MAYNTISVHCKQGEDLCWTSDTQNCKRYIIFLPEYSKSIIPSKPSALSSSSSSSTTTTSTSKMGRDLKVEFGRINEDNIEQVSTDSTCYMYAKKK